MKRIQAALARALGLRNEVQDQSRAGCGENPLRPHWIWYMYHDL